MRLIYGWLAGLRHLGGCGFRGSHADVVLHNGVVLTLDAASHEAQAIAVRRWPHCGGGPERAILNKYHADDRWT